MYKVHIYRGVYSLVGHDQLVVNQVAVGSVGITISGDTLRGVLRARGPMRGVS